MVEPADPQQWVEAASKGNPAVRRAALQQQVGALWKPGDRSRELFIGSILCSLTSQVQGDGQMPATDFARDLYERTRSNERKQQQPYCGA